MTEPQDPATPGADRLRAGHADREQVIEALKVAFMQGRLTGEELGARTGQVLAARTYAELNAITADLPGAPRLDRPSAPARAEVPGLPGLARAEVPDPSALARVEVPGLARRWPLVRAGVKSGGLLVVAAVLVQSGNVIANGDYGPATASYQAWIRVLNALALALVVTALVILGRGVATSVKQRRARKQLPPRPARGGHALTTGPRNATGPRDRTDQTRTDQTRTDLRTRISRPRRSLSSGRGAQAPRAIRPVPDAT